MKLYEMITSGLQGESDSGSPPDGVSESPGCCLMLEDRTVYSITFLGLLNQLVDSGTEKNVISSPVLK